MEDESSCGVTAAPPPLLDDGFAAGVLVELVAFGLDGGDVLGAAEGLGEVVDVTACVGVGPVHDELGLAGTVFWPVPPGGAELVVPWLGDVEPDAGGDVFGLPLGLLVG